MQTLNRQDMWQHIKEKKDSSRLYAEVYNEITNMTQNEIIEFFFLLENRRFKNLQQLDEYFRVSQKR